MAVECLIIDRTTDDLATDDGAPRYDALPEGVRLEAGPARHFLDHAVDEYKRCLASRDEEGIPHHLPRASGLLFGEVDGNVIVIRDIEFVRNVRDSDIGVISEFETTIAPRFGEVYRNPRRGFWCDDSGVLAAVKRQATNGLELMGSVHSHPDWHEIGPPHERFQQLSEKPTRLDAYLFHQSSWPVNLIWYVHGDSHGGLHHRVAGWRPADEDCGPLRIEIPGPLRAEFGIESAA
jgi:proteasome lid subunit RPN8/RPN11